jgi:hypothetical protein
LSYNFGGIEYTVRQEIHTRVLGSSVDAWHLTLIDYSSLMTENQRDAPGPDKILQVLNYVVGQAKSALLGNHWDPRFGNPLVAGSSPAAPTQKRQLRGQPRSN